MFLRCFHGLSAAVPSSRLSGFYKVDIKCVPWAKSDLGLERARLGALRCAAGRRGEWGTDERYFDLMASWISETNERQFYR